MSKFKAWFTPKRRKAIYTGVIAIGTCLVAIGIITPEAINNVTSGIGNVTSLLLALTGALAVININPE